MKLGFVAPFLARALEPPKPVAVQNAINLLANIGALNLQDESLTPLGLQLARLPIDPRYRVSIMSFRGDKIIIMRGVTSLPTDGNGYGGLSPLRHFRLSAGGIKMKSESECGSAM